MQSYLFAAQRPSDALALGRRHRPILLATCEGGPAAAAVGTCLGAALLALEDREPMRRAWSNEDLAAAVGLLGTQPHQRCPLLSYATDSRVEAEARRQGYSIAGPDGALKQTLDRKEIARQLFIDAGLATVPWIVDTRMTINFSALAERFGSPFVLQADRGSAGRGSHIVREESDLDVIREGLHDDVRILASPFLPGATLNVHGVVGRDMLIAGRASIQITGVADLTELDFGYCGNDFGAATSLSPALLDRAREVTLTVGAALHSRGWIGVFGLDLLLSGDALLPLEINPRFQGSSWLLAEVQQALGERPVGELHLDAVLGQVALPDLRHRCLAEPSGAFLILHQGCEAATLSASATTGIYQMNESGLRFTRAGIGLLECAQDEIYIEGFPQAGHVVERGAVLARVASWHRLVELDGRTLTTIGSALVSHLNGLVQTRARSSV